MVLYSTVLVTLVKKTCRVLVNFDTYIISTVSINTTKQGCFFIEENMKKKKENLKLCMIYHCKECPRARKCEEEQKRYEKNVKNNN